MAISLSRICRRARAQTAWRAAAAAWACAWGQDQPAAPGFSYVVDYADEARADDLVFEVLRRQGVSSIGASLPAIDGTRIDFVRQGLNESFRFENPNVRGECGCGESFTV